MKNKTIFVCNDCGYESTKWLGRCIACGAWNSMTEEWISIRSGKAKNEGHISSTPKHIDEIELVNEERFTSGIGELDRVLGGGIVKGSLVLVGGDPGIGKSTLMLQICQTVQSDGCILYASGEESQNQIKIRAKRLGIHTKKLLLVAETNLDLIIESVTKIKPSVLIIDSVQTMYKPDLTSAPGSVSQVREVTITLMRLAKDMNISVFLIGHVTKEGTIAGPRVLEHIVDCVLYFEGERYYSHRILRSVKNRFGSTNEIGIFQMRDTGLAEVINPSLMLLDGRPDSAAGSCIICTIEGSRPLLAEIQALVTASNFNIPRRMSTGIDQNRVALLMAVLEKRMGMNLGGQDAYINVIGGIRIEEPAADLGIVLAIASSFRNKPIPKDYLAVGEVGLTGEVRAVNSIEKRLTEASKLGFNTVIIPKGNSVNLTQNGSLDIVPVSNIRQALEVL